MESRSGLAPTFQMARPLMWNLLLTLGDQIIKKSNVNDGEITLLNGVVIRIRGADNPDSLLGVGVARCLCTEYARWKVGKPGLV